MKISYANDMQKGPGYGTLHCTETDFSDENITFALQRSTDKAFLNSQQEWLQPQIFLSPEAVRLENGEVALTIGPSVVNGLNPQETYRVLLRAANGASASSTLRVSDVIRGNVPHAATMVAPSEMPPITPPPMAEPAPAVEEPKPEPAPEPEASPLTMNAAAPEKRSSS